MPVLLKNCVFGRTWSLSDDNVWCYSIMNIVPTHPQVDFLHPLLPQLRQIGNSGHCDKLYFLTMTDSNGTQKNQKIKYPILTFVCFSVVPSNPYRKGKETKNRSSPANCSVLLLLVKWLFLWEIWLLNHHRPLTLTHTHTQCSAVCEYLVYTICYISIWNHFAKC